MRRKIGLLTFALAFLVMAAALTTNAFAAEEAIALDALDIVNGEFCVSGTVAGDTDACRTLVSVYSAQGQMLAAQNVTPSSDGRFTASFPSLAPTQGEYTARAFLLDSESMAPVSESGRRGVLYVTTPATTVRALSAGIDDIVIAETVGRGDVTLDGVDLSGGHLFVHGGGEDSIHIINRSEVGNITISTGVTGATGAVRVSAQEGSRIRVVTVDDGEDAVIIEGSVNTLNVRTSVPVTLRSAEVCRLNVEETGAHVAMAGSTNVSVVNVTAAATLDIEGGSKAAVVRQNTNDDIVTGSGTVSQYSKPADTAAQQLAKVKTAAHDELNKYVQDDYTAEGWTAVSGLLSAARSAIDNAAAPEDVTAALADAVYQLDDVARKAQAQNAVDDALDRVNAYVFRPVASAAYSTAEAVYAHVQSLLAPLAGEVELHQFGAVFTAAVDGTSAHAHQNGSYCFYVQASSGDAAGQSALCTVIITAREYVAPGAPEAPLAAALVINYEAETLNCAAGLEMLTPGGTPVESGASAADYIGGTLYIRVAADGETPASAKTPVNIPVRPAAPAGFTVEGNAITGLTAAMEYRPAGDAPYIAVTSDGPLTAVSGFYEVRYTSSSSAFASLPATISVGAGAAEVSSFAQLQAANANDAVEHIIIADSFAVTEDVLTGKALEIRTGKTLTVQRALTLEEGGSLVIPDGALLRSSTLTLRGASLYNSGSITNNGSIELYGSTFTNNGTVNGISSGEVPGLRFTTHIHIAVSDTAGSVLHNDGVINDEVFIISLPEQSLLSTATGTASQRQVNMAAASTAAAINSAWASYDAVSVYNADNRALSDGAAPAPFQLSANVDVPAGKTLYLTASCLGVPTGKIAVPAGRTLSLLTEGDDVGVLEIQADLDVAGTLQADGIVRIAEGSHVDIYGTFNAADFVGNEGALQVMTGGVMHKTGYMMWNDGSLLVYGTLTTGEGEIQGNGVLICDYYYLDGEGHLVHTSGVGPGDRVNLFSDVSLLETMLHTDGLNEIILISEGANSAVTLTENLTIPEGKTLAVGDDWGWDRVPSLTIASNTTLSIKGDLVLVCPTVNSGVIQTVGQDRWGCLRVIGCTLTNSGVLRNNGDLVVIDGRVTGNAVTGSDSGYILASSDACIPAGSTGRWELMTSSLAQARTYLSMAQVDCVDLVCPDAGDTTLHLEEDLTIPAGKRLSIAEAGTDADGDGRNNRYTLVISNGATLTVNSGYHIEGLYMDGNLTIEAGGTLSLGENAVASIAAGYDVTNNGVIAMAKDATLELAASYYGSGCFQRGEANSNGQVHIFPAAGADYTALTTVTPTVKMIYVSTESELRTALAQSGALVIIEDDIALTDDLTVGNQNHLAFRNQRSFFRGFRLSADGHDVTIESGSTVSVGADCELCVESGHLRVMNGAELIVDEGVLRYWSDDAAAATFTIEEGGVVRAERSGRIELGWDRICADGTVVNNGTVNVVNGSYETRIGDNQTEDNIITGHPFITDEPVTTQQELAEGAQNVFLTHDLVLDKNGFGTAADADDPALRCLFLGEGRHITVPEGVTLTVPEGLVLQIKDGLFITVHGTLVNNGRINVSNGCFDCSGEYQQGDGAAMNFYSEIVSFAERLWSRYRDDLGSEWLDSDAFTEPYWEQERADGYQFLAGSCGETANEDGIWEPYRLLTYGDLHTYLTTLWDKFAAVGYVSGAFPSELTLMLADGDLVTDDAADRLCDALGDRVTLPRTADTRTYTIFAGGEDAVPRYSSVQFMNKITIKVDNSWHKEENRAFVEAVFSNCEFVGGLEIVLSDGRTEASEDYELEAGVRLTRCEKVTAGGGIIVSADAGVDPFVCKDVAVLSDVPQGQAIVADAPVRVNGTGSFTLNGVTVDGDAPGASLRLQCNARHENETPYDEIDHTQCAEDANEPNYAYMDIFDDALKATVTGTDTTEEENIPCFCGRPILQYFFGTADDAELALTPGLRLTSSSLLRVGAASYWENDGHSNGGHLLRVTGSVTNGAVFVGSGRIDTTALTCRELRSGIWEEAELSIGSGSVTFDGGDNQRREYPLIHAASGARVILPRPNQSAIIKTGTGDSEQTFDAGAPHIFGGSTIYLGWGGDDIAVRVYKWLDNDWLQLDGFTSERIDEDEDGTPDKLHLSKETGEWIDGGPIKLEVVWNGVTISYEELWYKQNPEVVVSTLADLLAVTDPDTPIRLGADIEITEDVFLQQDVHFDGHTLTVAAGSTLTFQQGFLDLNNGGGLVNSGTVNLMDNVNAELTGATLENRGRFINNGNLRLNSSTLRHTGTGVLFENSGNIELRGGAFDLTGARANSFKNTRYIKVCDEYRDGGGDGSENMICALSGTGTGFSPLSEDSNWLDYTAAAFSAEGLAAANDAQASMRTALGGEQPYYGFSFYNRMDIAATMDIAEDMTLDGFGDYFVQGWGDAATLRVVSGGCLTVAKGNVLHVNSNNRLEVMTGGTLVTEVGQDGIWEGDECVQEMIDMSRIEVWPDGEFVIDGVLTNDGCVNIREEWNGTAFLPGGEISGSLTGPVCRIAHVHDTAQFLAAAADEDIGVLHIRESQQTWDGCAVVLDTSETVSKTISIDSNSSLTVSEGCTLTLSGGGLLNNQGDITVDGTLIVGSDCYLSNGNHIEVGSPVMNSDSLAGLTQDDLSKLLIQAGGSFDNRNTLDVHAIGLFAVVGGAFYGNCPFYDQVNGEDCIQKYECSTASIANGDGEYFYSSITFANDVTFAGWGKYFLRDCDFKGDVTLEVAEGRYPELIVQEGCSVTEDMVLYVTADAQNTPDAFGCSGSAGISGYLSGLCIRASVPVQVRCHDEGSFTLNDVTVTGVGTDEACFEADLRMSCYGEHENEYDSYDHSVDCTANEKGVFVYLSGPISNVTLGADATFAGQQLREFMLGAAWRNSEGEVTLDLGALDVGTEVFRVRNFVNEATLKVTGELTAQNIEISGNSTTDISSLTLSENCAVNIGDWDDNTAVILGAHAAQTRGREDCSTLINAAPGAVIEVQEADRGITVLSGEYSLTPGRPHIFAGTNIFIGLPSADGVNIEVLVNGEAVTGFAVEPQDGDNDGEYDKLHLTQSTDGGWFGEDDTVTLKLTWNGITIIYQNLWHKPQENI